MWVSNSMLVITSIIIDSPLQWRHNGCDGLSSHQPLYCLPQRLFRRRSKKTPKLRVTGLCAWPVTGEFPAQMASNAENVSIWWRHHTYSRCVGMIYWKKFFFRVMFPFTVNVFAYSTVMLTSYRVQTSSQRLPLRFVWSHVEFKMGEMAI